MNEIAQRVWAKKISIDDMVVDYKDRFSAEDALQEMEGALEKKEQRELENVFFVTFRLGLFDRIHIPVLQKLLLENWHLGHEDIVSLFQNSLSGAPGTIEVLRKAMDEIPEYLDEAPYIRRIFYAIGAQPRPQNMETLRLLECRELTPEVHALLDEQIAIRQKQQASGE